MGYLLRVTLKWSKPLVERNIIVPKEATFKQLHDIIQNATNFKSGVPNGGYHMYEFQLEKESIRITEDEESHLQHQHFLDHPEFYKEQLNNATDENRKFFIAMQESFAVKTRYPNEKIESYLNKHKSFIYEYDFGDGWTFNVELIQKIKNYDIEYPILISGSEHAPPEDVGGLGGFDNFKKIMKDAKHPEHEFYRAWSDGQGFEIFDMEKVNKRLKKIRIR